MFFKQLLSSWKETYYAIPLLILVELFALCYIILYARKDKLNKFFLFYVLFEFIIQVSDNIIFSINDHHLTILTQFQNITNILIAITELLVYNYFFLKFFQNRKYSILLKSFSILYIFLSAIYIIFEITHHSLLAFYWGNLLGGLEFILLIAPCLLYYRQLFRGEFSITLTQRPSFWIVTGMFFFAVISIPFYLLNAYIAKANEEYWHLTLALLYYPPFTINFIFLIKAFSCKKPLTI